MQQEFIKETSPANLYYIMENSKSLQVRTEEPGSYESLRRAYVGLLEGFILNKEFKRPKDLVGYVDLMWD